MKVHVVPTAGESTPAVKLQPIQAHDLTKSPEHRSLWRSASAGGGPPVGLPSSGFASPMGYWLSHEIEPMSVGDGGDLRITFQPAGTAASTIPQASAKRRRPIQTVKVKAPSAADGEAVLTIGPGVARISTSEAAWQALSEPVLLAVCQYWRFLTVDAEIDRLTELARSDLGHATMPGISSLKASKRLAAVAQDVRVVLLDLPHFEGPLTDPNPYCSSEKSAQVFELLAEKLHLEEWCELIDERAEAIEDTYEAVTEKLFEFKNFAWEAFLEVVIVVILVAELAVMAWEAFGP